MVQLAPTSRSKRDGYEEYDVAFLEKAKDFVQESETKGLFGTNKNIALVKTFDYSLDQIKEVHEIPSMNVAEVTVILEKENRTPFYGYPRINPIFIRKR